MRSIFRIWVTIHLLRCVYCDFCQQSYTCRGTCYGTRRSCWYYRCSRRTYSYSCDQTCYRSVCCEGYTGNLCDQKIGSPPDAVDDPCSLALPLPSFPQRIIGYELTAEEPPICDYYIEPGWYSMPGFILSTRAFVCGTGLSWYTITDPLNLTTTEMNTLSMCQISENDGDCLKTMTNYGRKCSGYSYVFYLNFVETCPEAYCIEPLRLFGTEDRDIDIGIDVTHVQPVISMASVPDNGLYMNAFYCDFDTIENDTLFYQVTWAVSSYNIWTDLLHLPDPVSFLNESQFREDTKLTHYQILDKGYGLRVSIACSVAAMRTENGSESVVKISPEQFCGIKLLNSSNIYSVWTSGFDASQTLEFAFEITVPICPGCSVSVGMVDPSKTEDECKLSSIVQVMRSEYCGFEFKKQNEIKTISLAVEHGDWTPSHNMGYRKSLYIYFRTVPYRLNTYFSDQDIDILKINLNVNGGTNLARACHSNNDPHMFTFDGLAYENQAFTGAFILYRVKEYKIQVQMKTDWCSYRSYVKCNCGVAINAGRDVYIVNACTTRRYFDIRYKNCEDGVIVDKRTTTNKIVVVLPTGAEIVIDLFRPPHLNIRIYPSRFDYGKTDGLCGILDGSRNNDLTPNPESSSTNFLVSWRVDLLQNQDLFRDHNYPLHPWPQSESFCSCERLTNEQTNVFDCSKSQVKSCVLERESTLYPRCAFSIGQRGKRSVEENDDSYTDPETNVDIEEEEELVATVEFDYETAKDYCLRSFQTPALDACQNITNWNSNTSIDDCIADILATNSTDWTNGHIGYQEDECIHSIQKAIPPSPEFFVNVTLLVDGEEIENITESGLDDITDPVFTEGFLDVVKGQVCPSSCNGRGKCVNETCQCQRPYLNKDCGGDLTKPVKMLGIPNRGKCDKQLRPCRSTSVFASNLAENTSCIIQEIKEVICELPTSVRKRDADLSTLDDIVASGYTITLTIDGHSTSSPDTIVIFDSACVNCTYVEGKPVCSTDMDMCANGAQCYSINSTTGCNTCTDIGGAAVWEYRCELAGCNPCLNGATCESGDVRVICKCPSGWKGTYCQLAVPSEATTKILVIVVLTTLLGPMAILGAVIVIKRKVFRTTTQTAPLHEPVYEMPVETAYLYDHVMPETKNEHSNKDDDVLDLETTIINTRVDVLPYGYTEKGSRLKGFSAMQDLDM
ncbi:von Willebrand factor D and EGF domain-containing protein-like isoform X2 [Mya arenaria]|uniref:von Willebrand factor D and EGF domain-containing protein-like isoform X2 n=1 Tax=Mya arenaria TaxID=6604 RepID=UPI0022E61A37|nr:von Willebrand factor D and EGF domain-containing protein-like isoform X2 [Mya arenaria]